MRRALVVALLLGACALAGTARADGDPASDYLYTLKVFLPFDVKVPKARQRELVSLVEATNRSGYAIRVAVIGSSYDLGSVTSLWRQPRTYARFLGAELQFLYAKRLLIVMPNGFGIYWKGHAVDREYALLSKVPIGQGRRRPRRRRAGRGDEARSRLWSQGDEAGGCGGAAFRWP